MINDFKNTRKPNPAFSLKVSEKQKYANDNEWFKAFMRYIVPASTLTVPDYDVMKMSYEIANNDLSAYKDKIEAFYNPLSEDIGQINEETKELSYRGAYTFSLGQFIIGYWRNNKLNGFGILYDTDNSIIYEGNFKDNKKEGRKVGSVCFHV